MSERGRERGEGGKRGRERGEGEGGRRGRKRGGGGGRERDRERISKGILKYKEKKERERDE